MAEPIVRCSYKEIVDVNSLKPHPKNPNIHKPKQLEMFMAILNYQGARRPVTVSTLSGFVTRGHGQLEAYRAAGWQKVPVDYQDYDSEQAELADMVADNQLARQSEMDISKLQELSVHLDSGDFNMELLGMENVELETLMISNKMFTPDLSLPTSDSSDQIDGPLRKVEFLAGVSDFASNGVSHVRMVQLFCNEQTQKDLLVQVEHFKTLYGTENLTDTVLAVMKHAYEASCKAN